jgi:hypothetical protein
VRTGVARVALFLLATLAIAVPAVAARIDLEAYKFDPSTGEPVIQADLRADAADTPGTGYYLVQARGPVSETWRQELIASGARVFGYVSENAYLVGLDPSARARVDRLPGTGWLGAFHPAYKLDPNIGLSVFVSPERLKDPNLLLMVRVFQDLAGTRQQVEALGGRVLDMTDDGFSRRLVVSLPKEQLHALARLPETWWIEEKPEFRVQNNTTKWVVQSNSSGWMPLWDHGLHGEGQIFTIMDSGVDYNSCFFRENGNAAPGPSHRKIIDYSIFGGAAYDGCDTGHGSHVAGTVAGDQSYINPGNFNYNGMAYKAKFTVQDVGADDWSACNVGTVNVPASLTAAFTDSYNKGARLHTNSWGSSTNAYDAYCVDVDNAMWQHKDFLVCFAAGNSGPGASTVASPGTAKNCVTVGATQQAPSQSTMASYSSRGPASDGRWKPTLTAPGGEAPTYIVSVDNNSGNPPSPTCATVGNPFQGTSMATPAVSGCALDVRQYYMDGFYPLGRTGGASLTPSAALIKATLVSSTTDMAAADIPNNNEGWGRLLVDNSLYFEGDTRELIAHDIDPGLGTGEEWTATFDLDAATEPLVITLVWTDYPATSGTGTRLVNDLDLTVTAPDDAVYKGNVFTGGQSADGGTSDRLNVEECVRRNTPATGRWTIRVNGFNVPQGPQPFAVVINGSFANWPADDQSAVASAAPGRQLSIAATPNPVRDLTSLDYAVPAGYAGPVRVEIVDVQGRTVRTIVNKGQSAGDYRVTWERLDHSGNPVAQGVYFARVTAGSRSATVKLVVG